MEPKAPKFAVTLSKMYVPRSIQKSPLGKPYIAAGAFWWTCGYLFQQCGLLGRFFVENPIPFIRVLIAREGKEQSALTHLKYEVSEIIPLLEGDTTFYDLVCLREKAKLKSTDNLTEFLVRHGQEKLSPDRANASASVWAAYGGFVGLEYPTLIDDLYEATYKPRPKGEWDLAHKLGVVDMPEQKYIPIDALANDVLQMFREYSKQFYPELFPVLFPGPQDF